MNATATLKNRIGLADAPQTLRRVMFAPAQDTRRQSFRFVRIELD